MAKAIPLVCMQKTLNKLEESHCKTDYIAEQDPMLCRGL